MIANPIAPTPPKQLPIWHDSWPRWSAIAAFYWSLDNLNRTPTGVEEPKAPPTMAACVVVGNRHVTPSGLFFSEAQENLGSLMNELVSSSRCLWLQGLQWLPTTLIRQVHYPHNRLAGFEFGKAVQET